MCRWRKLIENIFIGDFGMKKLKHYTLIVFMALLIFTFIGCGDTCDCGAVDCKNCTPIVYGNVYLDGDGGSISIYRVKAVTEAQMVGVVAKVQAGYDGLAGGIKPNISTAKVSAIYIDTSNSCILQADSKWIISLNYNNDIEAMTTRLDIYANNQLNY